MAVLANDIRVGSASRPTYQWKDEKIALGTPNGIFSVDILGNELTIDTFSFTITWNVDAPLVYAPYGKDGYLDRNNKLYLLKKPTGYGQNFLKDVAPGTPVFWYVAGSVFAKGYLENVQRVGKYLYKITCFSGIGLLDAKTHYGGMYSGVATSTILSSIIGSSFTYTVDADVGSVAVYGHLPYDNARNNLHTLLFAIGAVLMKKSDGNYNIEFLKNTMTNVPTSRIALNGKTEYTIPADAVEITEHSFFALNSDEVKTLFDNTNGASVDHQLVIFDDPMHDLSITGNLTINESSVNHAVVTGVGALSGKKYTHNSMLIRKGTGSNNVKKVENNELVSFANSYYVADRVYSYYTSTKQIDAKIMLENEKPGQLLSLRDAFGDPTNAYLSRADVLVTTVKGAQCRLISGFVPGSNGNNFNNRALITSNTTWTVPSGVTRIRIVLIGGGQGGQGGYDGADGLDDTTTPGLEKHFIGPTPPSSSGAFYEGEIMFAYQNDEQPPGAGGAAGVAGAKAAFLVSDKAVSAGNTIAIVVGVGGNGGARNGGEGSAGTPTTASGTTIGTLSSDDGVATYEGYNDPISGVTFAIDGVDGTRGGDGGKSSPYGWASEGSSRGENVSTYSGGAAGSGISGEKGGYAPGYFFVWNAGGGGGGGAAQGRNGAAATAARVWQERITQSGLSWYRDVYNGGNGGNGANAVAPTQPTIYGQGGAGGNGGGGGGNAGGSYVGTNVGYDPAHEIIAPGVKGAGGQGSAGSKGGNGCAIIYY